MELGFVNYTVEYINVPLLRGFRIFCVLPCFASSFIKAMITVILV